MKGNTYTWGLLRTTSLPWSKQCMQGLAEGYQAMSANALQYRINAKTYKIDQHIIINLFNSIKECCQIRGRWTLLDLQMSRYFPTLLLFFGSCVSTITISSHSSRILDKFNLFLSVIKCFIGLVPNFLLKVLYQYFSSGGKANAHELRLTWNISTSFSVIESQHTRFY